MRRAAVMLDFALAYVALSRDGRRFLRRQHKLDTQRTAESEAMIEDRSSRRSLISTLQHCDRMFQETVPAKLCSKAGRSRNDSYARLVPFAWIGLEIRTRFMEAFGVQPGEDANRLLCLLVFVHREWDDLIDHVPPEELQQALLSDTPPAAPLGLLYHLTNLHNDLARRLGCFEKMFEVWNKGMEFYNMPFVPEQADAYLEKKAEISEEAHFAVIPDLPANLVQALRPFSIWLSCLDDTADVERDRAQNRSTFMTLAEDPVAEAWRFEQLAEEEIHAAHPLDEHPLFLLMRSMTADVAAAVRAGRDIEHEFYGGSPQPATRIPDPSAPYRAAQE